MEHAEQRKSLTVQGKVVSNAMNKTVVIESLTKSMHPLFKKITTSTSKIKVHDEKNECNVGDTILAVETRPLSRDKRHKLVKIIDKAKLV
ncbi:30S ribosomal protein S17 [Leptospira sp. GIMC2001]|uniref:30S ribosomal protein S17 n=1 Tax=Leptospira sp. GIMC2001 TaxID=1513297 RepID=UPI002349F7BB|nr:30S ribosomal protein S17 [Leptospira sp. GIMC2001]WCL51089.1 30S ribosomal protein S17 [Leptospira sp. GIMC2001]